MANEIVAGRGKLQAAAIVAIAAAAAWISPAPAGTPPAIVNRLNLEIVKIINAPEVRKRLIDLGFVPVGNTPAEFAKVVRLQVGKWRRIVKDAGIKAE